MDILEIYKKSQVHKIISLDKSRGMLSHAYMLECADKFLLDEYVMLMAKEIYCNAENSPCDSCVSCTKISHSNMVDLKIYPKDKSIMVEDVVEIVSDAIQRPMDSHYKVFILKDFDESTVQAQNKLLKTLEEPPQNVVFLLTCSNSSAVLPTISSRVKSISEPLLDVDTVAELLKEKKVSDAQSIARVSGGNISTALKLAGSSEAGKIVDIAFDTLIGLKSSGDILKCSSKILALKKDFKYFIDTLILILRDASVCESKNLVNFKEKYDDIVKLSSIYSKNALREIALKVCEVYNKLEFNCNMTAIVDKLLLEILEVKFLCQK